ncbi:MAG TPA: hypothetical protein DCQ93_02890 [Bacteroidetes bacterium]|nr:hypothetical protein [Bacteroidota bacterium]
MVYLDKNFVRRNGTQQFWAADSPPAPTAQPASTQQTQGQGFHINPDTINTVTTVIDSLGQIWHSFKDAHDNIKYQNHITGQYGNPTGATTIVTIPNNSKPKRDFPWVPTLIIGGSILAVFTVGFFTNWFGLASKK